MSKAQIGRFLMQGTLTGKLATVSKNEMLDYLEYVRSSGLYKSETIETTLEVTPNVRDAIEVSIKVT
jgi:hypothetical protein